MNTIHSPSILNSAANASFIPICLPKYNASGFANAYISFMLQSEPVSRAPSTASLAEGLPASSSDSSAPESELAALASSGELPAVLEDRGAAMICISGGTNFEAIKTWCDSVTEVCSRSFTLSSSAYNRDNRNFILMVSSTRWRKHSSEPALHTKFRCSEFPVSGTSCTRAVLKCRLRIRSLTIHMMIWMSGGGEALSPNLLDTTLRAARLVTFYQMLHDAIHARSGQNGPLKLQYIRTEKESLMGWVRAVSLCFTAAAQC